MAYQTAAVKQSKTFLLNAQDGDSTVTLDSVVSAGSLLVVVGCAVGGTAQATLLTSVTDTSSNTWGSPTNTGTNGQYLPNVFACVAHNAASGSPTITLNYHYAGGSRVSGVVYEIEKVPTASAVDKTVSNSIATGAPFTTSASGALTQTHNLAILCAGGWIEGATILSGWSTSLNQANDGTYIGCSACYKNVTTTDSITGTVAATTLEGGGILLLVIKASESGSALRYKFLLNPSTFTDAVTGVKGDVWRNCVPSTGTSESYEDLEGDATDGVLYIKAADGLPGDVELGDTIIGSFYTEGGSGSRPYVTGTVEEDA